MAQQLEFVLRNDGFWWAPPIDPSDTLDFTVNFAGHLQGDTIEEVVSVTSNYVDVELYAATTDNLGVTIWLTNAINKKTATVTTTVRSVGGRTIQRTFKLEVKQL